MPQYNFSGRKVDKTPRKGLLVPGTKNKRLCLLTSSRTSRWWSPGDEVGAQGDITTKAQCGLPPGAQSSGSTQQKSHQCMSTYLPRGSLRAGTPLAGKHKIKKTTRSIPTADWLLASRLGHALRTKPALTVTFKGHCIWSFAVFMC